MTNLIIQQNTPPTFGTTVIEWEGYALAEEIVPGDEIIPLGIVTSTCRIGDDHYEIATADESDLYEYDVALYIVRKVKVTIEEV